MSFEVGMKKRPSLVFLYLFVRVLCVLMIAALVWFLNWDLVQPDLMQSGAYLFFVAVIGIFVLFFIYSFYAQRRPRIEVNGQTITFYPLWRPAKKVTLSEITSRKEKPDYHDPKQAVAAGALGGGLLVYAVTQQNASTMPTPKAMIYTYYCGDTKLITVSTRNMENVERFDAMVVDRLEGNLRQGKSLLEEVEAPMEETRPVKKTKLPFILAGVIGLICVALIAAVMLRPRTKVQSPDFLAGTSWIANNDGSQWVFREDKTFHWYQTPEETEDNYFAGTYEFHIGQDALNYLTTELSDYGVTEWEMRSVISRAPEYTVDNFVCFSCRNQSFMLRGEEQLSEETVSSYFGFLLMDGTYLDIANMTTGTYYGFTKE